MVRVTLPCSSNETVFTTPSVLATPRTSSTCASIAVFKGMVTDSPRQPGWSRIWPIRAGSSCSVTSIAV
jgi:hypothetical protein